MLGASLWRTLRSAQPTLVSTPPLLCRLLWLTTDWLRRIRWRACGDTSTRCIRQGLSRMPSIDSVGCLAEIGVLARWLDVFHGSMPFTMARSSPWEESICPRNSPWRSLLPRGSADARRGCSVVAGADARRWCSVLVAGADAHRWCSVSALLRCRPSTWPSKQNKIEQ
jgi:hypothetical protein